MREDLREAWRGLRASPATTALAAAILTVGIAAATVTFSVVDTVALRRLPFAEPDHGRGLRLDERFLEGRRKPETQYLGAAQLDKAAGAYLVPIQMVVVILNARLVDEAHSERLARG